MAKCFLGSVVCDPSRRKIAQTKPIWFFIFNKRSLERTHLGTHGLVVNLFQLAKNGDSVDQSASSYPAGLEDSANGRIKI